MRKISALAAAAISVAVVAVACASPAARPAAAEPLAATAATASPAATPGSGGGGDNGGGVVSEEAAAALANCDAVAKAYLALFDDHRACREDADCQILDGHCAQGLGGCWYAVNREVSAGDAERLAARHRELGCSGGVCRCRQPPERAECRDGVCAGVEPGG
jgi:hypothetical protein